MYADVFLPIPVDRPFTYEFTSGFDVQEGCRVTVPFRGRDLMGVVVRVHNEKPVDFEPKAIIELIDPIPIFDKRLDDLASYTAEQYIAGRGEVYSMALPSGRGTKNRYVKPFERVEREPYPLSEEQSIAAEAIWASRGSDKLTHLIFGVTGSGKTEVYIDLARRTIEAGQSVIYLVPEITLSSQLYRRLDAVFGDNMVIYHSKLTANQRLSNWHKFYKGEVKLVIGTRSAVFMQSPSLGMIIIDEEHDGSYKEHSSPRYNARRLALFRSKNEKALLILGSATPSVESFYAADQGLFHLHRLINRYGNSKLPELELVSVEPHKPEDMISSRLMLALKQNLRKKEQSLVLLNRRGFAPLIICNSCKTIQTCPNCNISLNAHRQGVMICHYCNYQKAIPKKCPQCGSDEIAKVGAGTQRLEEMIESAFKESNIFRLDQDSSKSKDAVDELVTGMESGEVDILLGTQMIAKGFDFNRVTLVGVILADIGLHLPDFRAAERIFALLVQVAGRCGRGELPGRVLVQTLDESHYLYQYLFKHDYEGFYREELEVRRQLGYPPFMRLNRLLYRGSDEEKVRDAIKSIAEKIRKIIIQEKLPVTLMGPAPAPLAKVANNYRYHLILKGRKATDLQSLIRRVTAETKEVKGLYLEIDPDPFDML